MRLTLHRRRETSSIKRVLPLRLMSPPTWKPKLRPWLSQRATLKHLLTSK